MTGVVVDDSRRDLTSDDRGDFVNVSGLKPSFLSDSKSARGSWNMTNTGEERVSMVACRR